MPDQELEHDSLDDLDAKAFVQPPENKMIEAPMQRKSARIKEMRRMQEVQVRGDRPHLDIDNPAIWDGEIE